MRNLSLAGHFVDYKPFSLLDDTQQDKWFNTYYYRIQNNQTDEVKNEYLSYVKKIFRLTETYTIQFKGYKITVPFDLYVASDR